MIEGFLYKFGDRGYQSNGQVTSPTQASTMIEVMGSNSRRKMLCVEQYEDRISNLPDSLIAQILSCLPTKYAVATSVLSTRWKQLWTLITSLDFDDELLLRPRSQSSNRMLSSIFTSFVCRVLSLYRGKCVQKFHLKCACYYNDSRVNGWIADMLLCDVKELDLSVRAWHSILLPLELCSCRTLVVLKLDYLCGPVKMDVPTLVSLPNLKILHLVGIRFVDYESIGRFLFGCPALEELNITRCKVEEDGVIEAEDDGVIEAEEAGVINVVAPFLTSLIIDSSLGYADGLEGKIVLDTPALLYLTISDSPAVVYLVKKLCRLIRADIDVYIDPTGSEGITNLLNGISGVQSLHFSCDSMMVIYFSKPLLPKFHNMTYLELGPMPRDGWKLLATLLENSPHLETLVFDKGLRDENWYTLPWNPPQNVPSCLLYCLKVIEIKFFEGKKEECEVVTYFLCNAKVLEKVSVHDSGGRDCIIQLTP